MAVLTDTGDGRMSKQKKVCGICGGTDVKPMGGVSNYPVLVCNDCKARFSEKWYSESDWEKFMDSWDDWDDMNYDRNAE